MPQRTYFDGAVGLAADEGSPDKVLVRSSAAADSAAGENRQIERTRATSRIGILRLMNRRSGTPIGDPLVRDKTS